MPYCNEMPQITYEPKSLTEKEILNRVTIRGRLRATSPNKPKLIKDISALRLGWTYKTPEDKLMAHAAYVWRQVAFCISPNPRHHHMPIGAAFILASKEEEPALNDLVDKIVDTIPKAQWHGVSRWAGVLY